MDTSIVDAALRLLSYRPRSETEIRQRLSRKFPHHLVDGAIDHLKNQGLINDSAFSSFWLQSRERNRPRGASTIRWELLRMGVATETVEAALEGFDEEQAALRAGNKVAKRFTHGGPKDFRRKLTAHLRRRGFGSGIVRNTVEHLWEELFNPVHGDIATEGHDQ